MNDLYAILQNWLGLGSKPDQLTWLQMSLRAFVMFLAALVILRIAHRRFFARRNTLDVLLTLVIASTLSRGINGSAPFFPTIGTGFVLVILHRVLTWASVRLPALGRIVKGSPVQLVSGGRLDEDVLRRHDITRHDLEEDLRLKGTKDIAEVASAQLERNGEISVIRA